MFTQILHSCQSCDHAKTELLTSRLFMQDGLQASIMTTRLIGSRNVPPAVISLQAVVSA